MAPWWGKPSSKEVKEKKTNWENIFDMIQRKFKKASEEKSSNKSGGCRKHHSSTVSKKGSRSVGPSTKSWSPSPTVSRCVNFADNHYSRPLPVSAPSLPTVSNAHSGIILTSKLERAAGDPTPRPPIYFPLPEPGYLTIRGEVTDVEGDIVTASISCDSSIDSDDSSDLHLVRPLASDCENRNTATTINNSFSAVRKDQSHITIERTSRAPSKPAHKFCNNKLLSTSPKRVTLPLQIGRPGGFSSAPNSSKSSPRSPMRAFGPEQVLNSGLWTGKPYPDISSGHCSSPGSGHDSSNNLFGGDLSAFRAHNKCSADCSPIPSPRMTSPGPSSRIHSNNVSPLHPKSGGAVSEFPTRRPHAIKQQRRPGGFSSAPNSSKSSPRSPMRAFGPEQVLNSGLWTGKPYPDIASGHCSSPGSGHDSSNNLFGGDLSAFRAHNKCSADCSPIPSPRMTSPGPSSRIHSNNVSPLHPKYGGAVSEFPTRRPHAIKQQSHRLPLPPIKVTKSCPVSPTYSASSTPSAPRSPTRPENSTSAGSRWTKGQLLGRGTFGHVYLGFSRESGKMCAMKEVTLFSDDPKSRECAQQLGQEIALLSQLRHPNIVQYYGSETVDDKLYIYLEYVSGGSIYKLLQEYGQLGEIAIRNYTRQILSGLAYLHAKNTVHRDIKGANILVDPNGQIKLADFGMAKHITGQILPFSFKGSPYWMAPEIIKNSDGCNVAVDIWSLGCTVLEMATAKPPWGQYEGVAAMFKIWNSRELPTIPDHLSEEGKDFVRLCLQRDPLDRPSAVQLLDHPFVKNASLERFILNADPPESPSSVINAMRSMAIGASKHNVCLDLEAAGIPPTRSFGVGCGSSNVHKPPRIVSCPVSPIFGATFAF